MDHWGLTKKWKFLRFSSVSVTILIIKSEITNDVTTKFCVLLTQHTEFLRDYNYAKPTFNWLNWEFCASNFQAKPFFLTLWNLGSGWYNISGKLFKPNLRGNAGTFLATSVLPYWGFSWNFCSSDKINFPFSRLFNINACVII